jgi:hypothetical protein
MSALAFDFSYDAPVAREDGVGPAPVARRRLYAVRGTVDEPQAAAVAAPAPAHLAPPVLRAVPTPTLDAVLGQTWSALATGFTACPVCHEETMTARWSAGHRLAAGRCASCGSTLE